jgi:hypothetical protein
MESLKERIFQTLGIQPVSGSGSGSGITMLVRS